MCVSPGQDQLPWLLVLLFLMQPRRLSAFFVSKAHSLLMFNLVSTRNLQALFCQVAFQPLGCAGTCSVPSHSASFQSISLSPHPAHTSTSLSMGILQEAVSTASLSPGRQYSLLSPLLPCLSLHTVAQA